MILLDEEKLNAQMGRKYSGDVKCIILITANDLKRHMYFTGIKWHEKGIHERHLSHYWIRDLAVLGSLA